MRRAQLAMHITHAAVMNGACAPDHDTFII